MDKYFKPFEKIIIIALMIFMAIVLLISTLEVGVIIIRELINPIESTGIIIDVNELVEIFGFFLNVLIGLELFETVKLYLKENVFHGEVILIIALIAISRKVII
ncbi:MAG: phosphate-starvation-inducible PsiE family protein, partial [Bacteroidales bacterium]